MMRPAYPDELDPRTAAAPPPDAWLTEGILGRRVLAWLVDGAILVVLGIVLAAAVLAFGVFTLGLGLPLLFLLPFLPLVYGTLSIASPMSATPGQAMLGLAVRRDADLGNTGLLGAFATVALFYLTFWASFIIQVAALVPFAGRRRLLHDILSGTVVVRADVLRDGPRPLTGARMPPNMR